MDLGISGRTAVIAGSSSGLGKAVALELALEGARVVINGRDGERLDLAARDIRNRSGAEVHPVTGDVSRLEDVKRLTAEAESVLGGVDILVANAGGPSAGLLSDFTLDHYRDAIELNLISTIGLCLHVLPQMRKRGWGRIVAITSIAAKQPVENLILSNTARAGVLGFMKSLSQDAARDGITANVVCPGYHLTDRLRALAEATAVKEGESIETIFRRWADSVPLTRLGDPEEFASVVAFLCSKRASYVNGAVIQIDGGLYRGLY